MAVAIRAVTRVQDADDAPSLGAGQNGYALTWNNATGAFVATALVTDHGALGGLSDDDHTGYALLAGRAGGQTLYGGTAANDDIMIHGTSDGTRDTSYVLLQPTAGNVGIGTSAPLTITHIQGGLSSPSLSAVSGIITIKGHPSQVALEIGTINGAPNTVWLQTKSEDVSGTGDGVAYPLALNPLAGNVGIGTTGPQHPLQVNGTLKVGGGNQQTGVVALGDDLTTSTNVGMYRGTLAGALGGGDVLNLAGWAGVNILAGNASFGSSVLGLTVSLVGNVGIGTTAPATLLHVVSTTATTNAVRDVLTLGTDVTSTGVGAAGLGGAILFNAESTTDTGQNQARIQALWTTATHATRTSSLQFQTVNSAAALATAMTITGAGLVGIGTTSPAALLHADQASTTGAVPVLTVDQADVSEEFIRFIGTSTTDATQSLVDAADMTTPGALKGWLKIYVQDDQATNPIVDGVYYVPFYAAPTA